MYAKITADGKIEYAYKNEGHRRVLMTEEEALAAGYKLLVYSSVTPTSSSRFAYRESGEFILREPI